MKKIVIFLIAGFITFLPKAMLAQKVERPGPQPAVENAEKFKLGIAGYTFAKIDIDKPLKAFSEYLQQKYFKTHERI